ncbi:hypothetical protein SPONL_144 [uncultured Candidatus Thioglobus sp.]|nr:hypothetical protein SPONL_144 [uncultured Candidatus Thioglobus sp.]
MNLRDIKPIVEIPDNSLIYLLGIIAVVFLLLGYLIWKKIKKSRRDTLRKRALKTLRELDFSNSKATAYDFELNASLLLEESNEKGFKQLSNELEQYKYKKQVDNLDKALIKRIKGFVDAL